MEFKNIIITGGASGIGEACVRLFCQRGWTVTFTDLDIEKGKALRAELGPTVTFLAADIRCRDRMEQVATYAFEQYGPITALFANAGIHRANTLLDISDEELKLMIDTNIYGTINTLQAVVPSMQACGGGSVIINVSDQWFVGKPHSFGYGLTKGALGQMTRQLSIDLGPDNVRVNAICAGTIHTPLVDNLFKEFSKKENKSIEEYWKEENALYARGKVGTPEEVAELVYFLAGDASSFCTGGHYLIDGGLVAR